HSQNLVKDSLGECYFFNVQNYPNHTTPNWGDADWATGGITHDDDNWYVGATNRNGFWSLQNGATENTDWKLWRIPVSEDLDIDNNPNVHTFQLSNSNLSSFLKRYGHIGDIDCYNYNGVD